MFQALREQLGRLAEQGSTFHTLETHNGSGTNVASLASLACECHWHIEAVWRGEANVTYVLLRYAAP